MEYAKNQYGKRLEMVAKRYKRRLNQINVEQKSSEEETNGNPQSAND